MENNVTELVFILDKSGSMAGLEKDTIGGFNAMIEKQKAAGGRVYVSTILFSSDSKVLHDRKSLDEIEPLTETDYEVGGLTALLDAVGGAIKHIGNVHKYARPEDVPEHTIFLITTDGMENASRRYTKGRVREMIKRQTERYGWEFIFLAANIDAEETAEDIGISRERAVNYCQDGEGIEVTYKAMCEAITMVRNCDTLDGGQWRSKLDEDNRRRQKGKGKEKTITCCGGIKPIAPIKKKVEEDNK